MYYEIHENIATYHGDEVLGLEYAEKALAILESVPDILKEQQTDYLMLLNSLTRHQFVVHGVKLAMPTMMKMRDVKPRTPFERIYRFSKFYIGFTSLHTDMGELMSPEIEVEMMQELKVLKNDLSDNVKLTAFYWLSLYNFYQDKFSEALEWMNKFLNHRKSEARSDLQVMARLLNMLIHYELGNFDLIEYNLKSTYRFAYKKEKLNLYERSMLSFFRKAINAANPQELEGILLAYKADLIEIFQDKLERRADDYFKNFEWIKSKLTGRPIIELIRETLANGVSNSPEIDSIKNENTTLPSSTAELTSDTVKTLDQ